MGLVNHIHLLDRIHHHIEHKSTGSAGEFASRLDISESTLYRILEELKDHGVEMKFDRQRHTYVYTGSVKIDSLLKLWDNKPTDVNEN